jgi:hypothetical protein
MRPRLPAVLTACLLVAACGGGATAEHKTKPKPIDSAATLAKMVGCTTPLHRKAQVIGAQVEKNCQVGKVEVSFDRYSDRATARQWSKVSGSFGVSVAMVNDHWVVGSTNRAFLVGVAKRNGWDLQ